ncbi:MAG TPA: GDP-mannose 4,6-dehydratase [Telluria sp.]
MNRLATENYSSLVLEGEGAGKRALITGLHGFTGHYMAQELTAAGYRVFGIVLPGEPVGPDVYTVDLCDRDALMRAVGEIQPDVVVHLAGIAFVAHANAELIYRVNIVGTRNLLEALAAGRHQPSSVLLASSANIYGHAGMPVIDESAPPAPFNDYGVSKLAMEHMAQLWTDRLPIIIVRPFNYTGVGQERRFLLPKIVSHFRKRKPGIELGNIDIERDFSDVRVVARSYRRLLALSPPGQTYNVCSGRAYSLGAIIETMSGIAGYDIKVSVNPAFVRAGDVPSLVGSNHKLASVIGDIEPTPLEETLRWMYQA